MSKFPPRTVPAEGRLQSVRAKPSFAPKIPVKRTPRKQPPVVLPKVKEAPKSKLKNPAPRKVKKETFSTTNAAVTFAPSVETPTGKQRSRVVRQPAVKQDKLEVKAEPKTLEEPKPFQSPGAIELENPVSLPFVLEGGHDDALPTSKLFLLQLPSTFPSLSSDLSEEQPVPPQQGKLRIRRSGKMELVVDQLVFDVCGIVACN